MRSFDNYIGVLLFLLVIIHRYSFIDDKVYVNCVYFFDIISFLIDTPLHHDPLLRQTIERPLAPSKLATSNLIIYPFLARNSSQFSAFIGTALACFCEILLGIREGGSGWRVWEVVGLLGWGCGWVCGIYWK